MIHQDESRDEKDESKDDYAFNLKEMTNVFNLKDHLFQDESKDEKDEYKDESKDGISKDESKDERDESR